MAKIKHLLLLVCMAGCLAACKKDTTSDFDVEAQFRTDTTAIRAFIKANNIPAIKSEQTGIFYQIINPGTGSVTYTTNTIVTANYEGKLLNGVTFDKTDGTPRSFTLANVIPGWQFGIPLIQNGGRVRLLIPSYYGYGNYPKDPIPPNSVLDFDITLTNVQP